MDNQVIGYKAFKSKAGKDCVVLKVMCDATPRDEEFGHYGKVIRELFVPESQHSEIDLSIVGKECIVNRSFSGYIDSIVFR